MLKKNQREMKYTLETALITLGFCILAYSIYQYTTLKTPTESITEFTTSKLEYTTTTELFEISTTKTTNTRTISLPTWIAVTTATSSTTTTLIPYTCLNNQRDSDEEYADCGMQCGKCILLEIKPQWTRYLNENLWLRLDAKTKTTIVGGPCKDNMNWSTGPGEPLYHCFKTSFNMSLKTSEDTPDVREMSTGEVEHVDGFEVMLLYNTSLSTVIAYVKKDYNTMGIIPEYTVLSLGGGYCASGETGFCKRHWQGYTFYLRERSTDQVKIDVTLPSGKKISGLWLTKGDITTVEGARIGLLYAVERGGYCTIYVKKTGF